MIFSDMEFHNVEELVADEGREGLRVMRIPESLRMKLCELGKMLSQFPCATEIRFNMTGETVKIKLLWGDEKFPMEGGMAQIYFGSFQFRPKYLKSGQVEEVVIEKPENLCDMAEYARRENLPFDTNLVRVLLPYEGVMRFIGVEGDVLPPEKWQIPQKRYLAYGSSITQGSSMSAYAAKTAKYLGADFISLGLAGSAKLEADMAEYIAGRDDWDYATLELGINMLEDFTVEAFKERVNVFLPTIAEKHKDKWIFCIDLFTHAGDYKDDKKTAQFREIVKDAVEKLALPKLVHIPGQCMLRSLDGLSADGIHPSAFGVDEIALNLSGEMKKNLCR